MIQRTARACGLQPETTPLRSVQIAVAHAADIDVKPFWNAIFGYAVTDSDDFEGEDAVDPEHRLPPLWFHEHRTNTPGRGRTHIDVYLPAEQAERTLHAALAAGGRIASSSNPPHWWTLVSPDGHGVDLAPWPDSP